MLKYVLVKCDSNVRIYDFFPEGDIEKKGTVAFYSNGEKCIVMQSPADFAGIYAGHALHGIDLNKERGTVAWY